jgi:hypothetical protein
MAESLLERMRSIAGLRLYSKCWLNFKRTFLRARSGDRLFFTVRVADRRRSLRAKARGYKPALPRQRKRKQCDHAPLQTRAEFVHAGGEQDFAPTFRRNTRRFRHFRRARAFFGERKL